MERDRLLWSLSLQTLCAFLLSSSFILPCVCVYRYRQYIGRPTGKGIMAMLNMGEVWADIKLYRRAYLLTAVASFGGMLFGWDTGLIGGRRLV